MTNYRRIYFDKAEGLNIITTFQYGHNALFESIEDEILKYKPLADRVRDTYDVLELPFESYYQDFATPGVQYRVNPETKELEFSYPDPNTPEEPQPYQKPLSQEVKDLRMEVARSNTEMFEMMIMMSGGGM